MIALLRFHLDEHVDPVIADALRRRGIDVTTTQDAGLSGAADLEQLEFARRERRVLVTHDADFLVLVSRSERHCGICYSHQAARTTSELIKSLSLLAFCVAPEELSDRIEFL